MQPEAISVDHVFARRLREVRKARDWSQEDLARRMRELGYAGMDRLTILRIERAANPKATAKARRVTIGEAFQFAAALGVSPTSLFLPASQGETVKISDRLQLESSFVRAWLDGWGPLVQKDLQIYRANDVRALAVDPQVGGVLESGRAVNDEEREALFAFVNAQRDDLATALRSLDVLFPPEERELMRASYKRRARELDEREEAIRQLPASGRKREEGGSG